MARYVRNLLSTLAIAIVGLLVMAFSGSPAAAAPSLPEDFNFFGGIPYELAHPNGSLPGVNDYGCRPTAAHPNPVVLVHGTGGGGQTNWGAYAPMLSNAGFCVFALTYGAAPGAPWPLNQVGGALPIEQSAAQLKVFISKVLYATHAAKVDIVGHSQGDLVPDYYAKFLGGAPTIDKYVSLAAMWRGTGGDPVRAAMTFIKGLGVPETAVNPVFASAGQMATGSDFLTHLWSGGTPYVPGIAYTNISTRYDEIVVPYTSGQVPGGPGTSVRNIVVQDSCAQDYSDHLAIAGSKRAAYFVHNALDPAHPWTVPCEFVPPFTGR